MKRRYGLLRFGLSVAVCLIAALLASLQPALSQEVTASIVGTVTDQSGAAIGPRTKMDEIQIKWPEPSGLVEKFTELPLDRYVTIVEGQGIKDPSQRPQS